MIIKKSGKNIFGADLTRAEEKALNIEIQKQIANYDRDNADEIDAIILWVLHEEFGFGKKRLRRFYDAFKPALDSLCERYQITDRKDELWVCKYKLLDHGVDIQKWNGEDDA